MLGTDWAETGRDRRDEAIQRGRHVPLSQRGRLSVNYDLCNYNTLPTLYVPTLYQPCPFLSSTGSVYICGSRILSSLVSMDLDRIASPPSALLLLPPPSSASFEQLQEAYRPSIKDACARLPRKLAGVNQIAVLDVALCIPGLLSPSCLPRARVFACLQRLLADVYKLVGIACTEQGIELDVPGGLDVRVVFLDFDPAVQEKRPISQHGPILDLQTLASSGRPWDWIYYPENPSGQALATAFKSIYSQSKDFTAGSLLPVPGGIERPPSGPLMVFSEDEQASTMHYSIAVGGTFDHVHLGHKLLLTAIVLAMEPVQDANTGKENLLTVGVTGDALLVNKKYAEFLESWDERCQSTASFLSAIIDFRPSGKSASSTQRVTQPGPNGKYILTKIMPGLDLKLVEISDMFGPTITDEGISALVVSKETRSGGAAVNDERAKKGWKSLDVFEVDVLESGEAPTSELESFASKISSTDIRRRRKEMAAK